MIKVKKLVFWGVGLKARHYSDVYGLKGKISFAVDSNDELAGKSVDLNGNIVQVLGIEDFIRKIGQEGKENFLVFITLAHAVYDVICQIDSITELDGMECCVGELINDYYEAREFDFPAEKVQIPKKIHYCWFGKSEIPDGYKRCMETWEKQCPDYEIIRWDESNYDIGKNVYMKQAYEAGKYGFVPDYARKDIVYNEGGIYLDCDLELIQSLDKLLNIGMFCGFICYGIIALGLGFGAVKGHPVLKDLMSVYDDEVFIRSDGSLNMKSCYWYENKVFTKRGFKLNNEFQRIGDIVVYPSEVLSPDGESGFSNNYTEKTISASHAMMSWINDEQREARQRMQKNMVKRLKSESY